MTKPVLHDFAYSGHAHRIRLMLSLLEVDYETVPVDMASLEHYGEDYRRLNPRGQVPTLVHEDNVARDSVAAIVYLARRFEDPHGRDWYPLDPVTAMHVQEWLSTAQGELYRGVVAARAGTLFGYPVDVGAAQKVAGRMLKWLNAHLAEHKWLATDAATVADVAMYSYLKVAHEGGVELEKRPEVRRWLSDVESLEGFLPMPQFGQAS